MYYPLPIFIGGLIVNCLSIALLFYCTLSSLSAQDVFISEIYFNPGSTNEEDAIEVAAPAGTNLNGWQLLLYDGETGTTYNSHTFGITDVILPTDTIDGQFFGTKVKSFGIDGIQNGSPDGVALVNPQNEVIEFFSYGGTFTPTEGPAAGQSSKHIGNADVFGILEGHSFARNLVCIPRGGVTGPVCIDSSELFAIIKVALNELIRTILDTEPPSTPNPLCWGCENKVSYTSNQVKIGSSTGYAGQNRLQVEMRGSDQVGLSIRNYSTSRANNYGLMVLANSGKAGFFDGEVVVSGTVTADRLDINDIIYAKEMIVKVPPFPDYVFSPTYQRWSLPQVEAYIHKHQHLPNIPSAAEVAEKGLEMGDFQIKQMEKIEEIFLHLIDLNKKVLQLEEENKALKATIEQGKP